MLVAVNKVDKEGAQPDRVRTEMTQLGLQPVEWGGDTEFVNVSAKTREGLDNLLDTIIVMAEVEELKANPDAAASGTVIESKLDPGRGPVVTILVSRGTLEVGDALVAGAQWGRVRASASARRCPASRSRCSASMASRRPASTSASSSMSAAPASWRASERRA
jgi:translation initiation factor IF-2